MLNITIILKLDDFHTQQQIYLDICFCASKCTSHANIIKL